MLKSWFTEEQIVGVFQEHTAGQPLGTLCRQDGISEQMLYVFRCRPLMR